MQVMALGMLQTVAAWLGLGLALAGVGLAVARLAGRRVRGPAELADAFWTGWAVVAAFLLAWHLVAPVDELALGVVALGGLAALWAWGRPALGAAAKQARGAWAWTAAGLLLILWLANRAMGPMDWCFDAGLYHVGAVRWAEAHPVVPGLGNLHFRLGFHSVHFLFLALVDRGPWEAGGQHLVNGLLLAMLLAQGLVSLHRTLGRGRARAHDILRLGLLAPVVHRAFIHGATDDPDLAVFVLGVVVSVSLCRMLFARTQAQPPEFGALRVALLAAAGTAVKLSFAPFGLAAVVVALWAARRSGARLRTAGLVAVLAAGVVLVPWVAGNVLLTGYPLYPSTVGGPAVDWRMPADEVRAEARWIRSWAREHGRPPDEVLGDWAWLAAWARRTARRFDVAGPLALGGLAVALALMRRRPTEGGHGREALLAAPGAAAVAVTFLVAPDPRFAGAGLWVMAACAVVAAWRRWRGTGATRVLAAGLLAAAVLVAARDAVRHGPLVPPGPERGFHPLPEAELRTVVTRAGLAVHTPVKGAQCWDGPLLCTPQPDPGLALRQKGDLSAGFRMLGEEQ